MTKVCGMSFKVRVNIRVSKLSSQLFGPTALWGNVLNGALYSECLLVESCKYCAFGQVTCDTW